MKENRQTFLNRLIPHLNQTDIDLIMFAYDLSKEAHRTHHRKQGGRYFEHPRAGCIILMDELGTYEPNLLIAFLLHDVGEDTPLFGNVTQDYAEFKRTATFRIARIFGAHVADTVIRLTKPHLAHFPSKAAMMDSYLTDLVGNDDALIGKAVDRLHNLRTLPKSNPRWITAQVRETQTLLIPVFQTAQEPRKELMDRLITKINAQIQALEASPN